MFWKELKKPLLCSAPMSGVTDAVFRKILTKNGKPAVIFTEFVSCDGLCSQGKEKLLRQLQFSKEEKPIVAQLFGSQPDNFYTSARLVKNLGFDGIDINMGCPDRNVIKQKAGAYLIKTPRIASQIIQATKKGAGDLPISVKTRIGYDKNQIKEWASFLLQHKLAALTIHGRTKQQAYTGKVNWQAIYRTKEIAKKISPETLIIGNGDIKTLKEAFKKAREYKIGGIMVGRALLNDIFFFNQDKSIQSFSSRKRAELLIQHAQLFEDTFPQANFSNLKKFFKGYISDFKYSSSLREKLMKANNSQELKEIVDNFFE